MIIFSVKRYLFSKYIDILIIIPQPFLIQISQNNFGKKLGKKVIPINMVEIRNQIL